ncbi:hypothetical protein [Variovorax sp. PvP013]|uniref:hypothetical protein n=1 Tax=Variovorax sp. PvP013 TaxID=3156435 RepID=UPI003D1ABBAC
MTFRKTVIAIFCVVAIILLFHTMSKNSPRFQGSFHWKKMEIRKSGASNASDLAVYESIEKMIKIFQLEVGDECYFLEEEEWIWRDAKDPVFALAPVFCPKKGGGWAMLPKSN